MAGITGALRRMAVAVLTAACLLGVGGAVAHASAPLRWGTPHVVDTGAPYSAPAQPQAVACPTSSTCLAVGTAGTVVSTTGGVATVSPGVDGGSQLQAIACPAASLCVIAAPTALLTSTDPTAPHPSWSRVRFHLHSDEFQAVTCASASLCIASEDSNTVLISTDPAAASSTWKPTALPAPKRFDIYGIGCAPQTTFCVASTGNGGVDGGFLTTSDPARGASAWRASSGTGLDPLSEITCVSTRLCLGYWQAAIETSADPAAGASSWSVGTLTTGGQATVEGLSCPGASACVAALTNGAIATTSSPASPIDSWTVSAVVDPAGFAVSNVDGIACPTTTSCLVPDPSPGLATVTVGSPAAATVATGLGGTSALTGLSCPSASLCVGVDRAGSAITTTAPGGPPSGWTRAALPGATRGLAAVDCPTTRFCAAVGRRDTLETTADPGPGAGWRQTTLPGRSSIGGGDVTDDLASVSCASATLCVVGTSGNGLLVSTDPGGGPTAWRYDPISESRAFDFAGVSCPSTRLCVAGDLYGRVAVSTHPGASHPGWKLTKIAGPLGGQSIPIVAVSCAGNRLCVAAGDYGAVYWSTHPAAGRSAWHRVRLINGYIKAVSCPSAQLCVVSGSKNQVLATTDPTGAARAWRPVRLAIDAPGVGSVPDRRLSTLACAPQRLCLAATGIGAVSVGTTG